MWLLFESSKGIVYFFGKLTDINDGWIRYTWPIQWWRLSVVFTASSLALSHGNEWYNTNSCTWGCTGLTNTGQALKRTSTIALKLGYHKPYALKLGYHKPYKQKGTSRILTSAVDTKPEHSMEGQDNWQSYFRTFCGCSKTQDYL